MTAPKPGDRVRVTETYEGVWTNRSPGRGMWGVVVAKDYDVDFQVTVEAKVEVLPKRVYVNHDTTEYWVGDVARDRRGDIFMRGETPDNEPVWTPAVGIDQTEPPDGPLTLLVRDGQVVT